MKKIIMFFTVVVLILATGSVQADTMMFTHEGNGSGTLGDVQFSADFVITAYGDTGDREPYEIGWFIDHLSASISIDGLGEFDFLTGTRTFVANTNYTVGFSREGINGADLFNGPTDTQFTTWDMLGPIGPISGPGYLMQWTFSPVDTTGGILVFNSGVSDAIFTATMVPVPGAVLLGILGLGAAGIKLLKFA